ncbi:lipoprotein NlpI [Colwellia sp. MB3u-70]|uniref:lipoprotein NlpI n=1 Tax=unclassified Colwellia TaxID=196834 RepID=UPI0015F6ABA9|nr:MULTISPECIES: lipoprotein NlpI [unclassified Colwellia]MBA6290786.1 lipoprotein NlpI [Colwellia sp. MB3u-8]MBA6306208.1 lipoprotein NlpI [Colwellia sp. MB3u-70]
MRLLSKTQLSQALLSKVLLISGLLLTQGCLSTSPEQSVIGDLIIAEPIAISYKNEIALARLTQVLQRAEISDGQRAELFYQRGVEYDKVGLRALARFDFNQAINLKPDMSDAYNFLGIHFTQLQEFNQAYDAFDSAIELAPDHEYAYLNRGIALYYGGRPNLAADDFKVFRQYQQNDPYRLLWQYLADVELDQQKANQDLVVYAQQIDESVWAKNVIKLYLGEMSQGTFIDRMADDVNSNEALTERLCEAYFYLGKYSQLQGDVNAAINFFKLALSTNVYEFVEHRYAKLELDLMRETTLESSEP